MGGSIQLMQALHEVFSPSAKNMLQGFNDAVDTLLVIFGTTRSKWQMCN